MFNTFKNISKSSLSIPLVIFCSSIPISFIFSSNFVFNFSLSLTSTIISGYFLALLSSRFSSNIRKKLFYKVESLSLNEIKKFETSSLITRTTNDISQVEMLIGMGLQQL